MKVPMDVTLVIILLYVSLVAALIVYETKIKPRGSGPSETATPIEIEIKPEVFIPFYLYPNSWLGEDGYFWKLGDAINSAITKPLVIINPGNGIDATSPPNTDWVTGMTQADTQAGTPIDWVGYVYSSYGARDATTVKAEIDGYFSDWGVKGIFIDEVSTNLEDEAYYRDLVSHARGQGAEYIILNPGTTPPAYMKDIADITITFEGSEDTMPSVDLPEWEAISKTGAIVHSYDGDDVDGLVRHLVDNRKAGWVFVTNEMNFSTDFPTTFTDLLD